MALGGVAAMGGSGAMCTLAAMALGCLVVGVHHIVPRGLCLLATLSWPQKFEKMQLLISWVGFMNFLLSKKNPHCMPHVEEGAHQKSKEF